MLSYTRHYKVVKSKRNKHGLTRYIPAEVGRQLRQEAGFGCAVCGAGFYVYEHIDPEFKDAEEHNPASMVLLCPSCHGKVTSKAWSKSKIVAAKLDPFNLKHGTTHEFLDLAFPLKVKVGATEFSNFQSIVGIEGGDEWFTIEPPEVEGAPPRLNAKFYSSDGRIDLEIVNNQWIGYTESWDVTFIGRILIIRRKKGDIALKLVFEPPHILKIERMHLLYYGNSFRVDSKGTTTLTTENSTIKLNSASFNKVGCVFQLPASMARNTPVPLGAMSYLHQCKSCSNTYTVWATAGKRNNPSRCLCGGRTELLVTAPNISSHRTTGPRTTPNISHGSIDPRTADPLSETSNQAGPKLVNCVVSDCEVGVSLAPGTAVEFDGLEMRRVKQPFVVTG